jgi:hypothetical protein
VQISRTIAALVTVATLAAACSSAGNETGTTAPPTTGASRLLSACRVVPEADATEIFGRHAKLTSVTRPSGAVSSCGWTADSLADTNDPRDISYKLELYGYQGAQFYGEHKFVKPNRLPGIGDQAFMIAAPSILQAQIEKNGNVLSVAYSVTAPFVRPTPRASAQRAQFIALLRAAAARM